ncbi:hypothetical protein V0288_25105 [Pannus brasiliensis CCIBt3594]|uniref:Uncharacterized protein n=1 Tax=Pannus brasiliensis CCIBt3594 TaxID=1427578 RepID=A0AAW9R245_9CHRO
MRLKRWESPRRQGRNDKGKGGSARSRQIRKQFKTLAKKLKGGEANRPPFFLFLSHLPRDSFGKNYSPEKFDLSR